MSFNKNLKKLLSEPTEMRISEITNVLAYFGFQHVRTKGSHYIFDNSKNDTIVIPVHNGKVIRYYLKYIKSIIKEHEKNNS